MNRQLTLKPHLMSEKAYAQSKDGVYVFKVSADANKHSVARAVSEQFDVKVSEVNIVNIPGKNKRTLSLNGKRMKAGSGGQRPDVKKAYVRLAEGNSLPFFAAVEEAETKQEEAQEKVAKAAEKAAKKDEKAEKPKRGLRRKSQVEDDK